MVSRIDRYPVVASPDGANEEPQLKLLLLGTCAVSALGGSHLSGVTANHYLHESYSHSVVPQLDTTGYDAVVASLTLRHIFGDATKQFVPDSHPCNCIFWPRAVAEGREQEYFDTCTPLVEQQVDRICQTLTAAPIFFLAFVEPKHNYLGNLLPRYQLTNPVFFVRKLNEVLEGAVAKHRSAYFVDLNEIISLLGSARIQDDYLQQIGHASYISDDLWDKDRISSSVTRTQMYESKEAFRPFTTVLAQRLRDDLAIIKQPLKTKAVIVDLDDTLWRGVAADEDKPNYEFTEGWPLGFAEALLIYKARGGLLAICSKNDKPATEKRLEMIYQGRLAMNDFASVRINFKRKSENISEILDELNIVEENALFIDDDPRETDEVRAVFPKLQIYCNDHYDWRRKILMLPGTQVQCITKEATLRTQSIQAKVQRDKAKLRSSPEEWLASLDLVQEYALVRGGNDRDFARAFELINKTNQFNTTGKRWTQQEIDQLFVKGGYLLCSFLRDRTTDNGLIGVTVILGNEIVQAALSCRVFNLQSEYATGHWACCLILASHPEVTAQIIDTGRNFSCHQYFKNMGFREREGMFVGLKAPQHPPHLTSKLRTDRTEDDDKNGAAEALVHPALESASQDFGVPPPSTASEVLRAFGLD
jgi:FkbH-like protein